MPRNFDSCGFCSARSRRTMITRTPATECRARKERMSTTIHVRNGTPAGNVSLCQTCRYAHIQQGYADSEEQVRCGYFYEQVRVVQFAVRTCTDYVSKLVQTVYEMEKVAVILDAKEIAKRRGTAGFSRVKTVTSKFAAEDDDE